MNIQNRLIYKLKDRLGVLAVVPLGESDFTIDYDRENEEKLSYKVNLSGKIKFINAAFKRIMEMENSIYRCDEQIITVYKICNGIEKPIFEGKISLNEGEFDLDKCEVVLKFIEDNSDKCYNDNKGTKLNVFQLIYNRIIAKTAAYNCVIETKRCTYSGSTPKIFIWCGPDNTPMEGNWEMVKTYATSQDGIRHSTSTTWKREIIEIDCGDIPEFEWVLVEDNCTTTGKKKYARLPTLINCVSLGPPPNENESGYTYDYSCDILGCEGALSELRNGVHFTNVMIELLKAVCPLLTLKSDFFQINPDNVSNINYVTGKISKVDNIIIFQKSDVKRPSAVNIATKLELTLENVLEVLLIMFNVKWRIVGNVFRLEHVSYFSKSIGIDVTTNELKKWFVGKRKYSYESEKIPSKESFKFKEQQGNDWNLDVIYSGCVSKDSKNAVTNIIDEAMTDVIFAINNPESDSKIVDDKGFVLVSTRKVGDNYFINSEPSPNGSRLNNVFAWVQLFRDYLYYERPMKTGSVNGVLTEFITTIPTKKGDRFAIPLDMCSGFNPDNFIKTALGNGILSSGKYRVKDSMIELDLLYESNQNLVPNDPPVLDGGGFFDTYEGLSKLIDIVATDSDGFITAINIIVPPSNGTVDILSFSQVRYTPNDGFTGNDVFSLQAVDNLSELSNIEVFGMNVLAENLPPIARDDEYFVWIGEAFVQGTSIFANDTDDYDLISIVNPNLTTTQGVSIVVDAGGFFNYVPPVGFVENDYFDYQIKDDLGSVSGAKVTLKVANKNFPIAVKDTYQTIKNTPLNVDGSTIWKRKVTFNDYTPDGLTYVYTTTAETKSTEKGGNVVIGTDGTFVYTPPNNFTGKDSFTYTVSNSNGSTIGTVEISVIPTIYVKLTTDNLTTTGGSGQPFTTRRQDYILSFFSDAAGAVPFDVTGLDFQVNMKEKETTTNEGETTVNENFFTTSILSGTSFKILANYLFFARSSGGYAFDSIITVENGSYTKI